MSPSARRPHPRSLALLALALSASMGCPKDPSAPPEPSAAPAPEPGDEVVRGPQLVFEGAEPSDRVANPTAPAQPSGETLPWPSAPLLDGVEVVRNRDSAVLLLPAVEGARDYRAFLLTDDMDLQTLDGDREKLLGATIHCAGYRQHNDADTGVRELVQAVEVTNLPQDALIVIEALDRVCPFTGVMGSASATVTPNNAGIPPEESHPFSVYTEAEIVQTYGSLILNGHGHAEQIGLPAPPDPPVVLARTALRTRFDPQTPPPVTTFFDDFADPQPLQFISEAPGRNVSQQGKIFQNDKWSVYSYGSSLVDIFFDRGQLHTILADWNQDIFGHNIMYPRQPVQIDDELYLHATFEVHGNATGRRYWWFFVCGADEPGQTFTDDGLLADDIIRTSFFYQPDGRNPSFSLWNCFQMFPRDGFPYDLAPSGTRPQSDLFVMVNEAGAPVRDNVTNLNPDQYGISWIPRGWFRTQDADGNLTGPIMDDQLLIAPRARYDVYLRRDRVMLYVNGDLRLCNDFPDNALTMAEGALGFGQVLYHSAAERLEFFKESNLRSGQWYYRTNTPFLDARTWDNMGYDELVAAPADFDPSVCAVHHEEG